ncbi:CitMHS family transporter [Blastomonas sp.]|uniref:CitMHS family transporter n=1 Tax=Blastomonas sp. TaxID=1909299 RepID=UPI002625081B|nr:CitMHS family transporter [Blastomonas sp.]MDM7955769.1 CitMHS family transporter [Blastomonas sp.]
MLTLLGFGMVVTFMVLIMTKRLSPMVALIVVPLIFAIVGGFGDERLGPMMLEGIRTLAPTGVMLMFAILYFGVMIDAGLFDPIVRYILALVGGDPMKVVVGTAVLAAAVSLDGDGSTTYMITVASMLPLYRRLGMSALSLTCVTMLASGVMNLTPWGGPLARVASALQVDPSEVFVPMIPAMIAGIIGVFGLAYYLGIRERRRLPHLQLGPHAFADPSPRAQKVGLGPDGSIRDVVGSGDAAGVPADPQEDLRRPRLLWVNAALTTALMTGLIANILPLPVLFMIGFAVALVINYPRVEEQRRRVAEHAQNVIAVVSLIFAAGIFTGILSGTGMVDAMSRSFLAAIPDEYGPYLAPITALASLPFTFFISNDAFYFGIMPIIAEAGAEYGISHAEMARASLIGQPVHLLSPLVPSTYLLAGLAGVDFADHQRFCLKWAVMICMILMAAGLLLGLFPWVTG